MNELTGFAEHLPRETGAYTPAGTDETFNLGQRLQPPRCGRFVPERRSDIKVEEFAEFYERSVSCFAVAL
jgi:hypothetical protein